MEEMPEDLVCKFLRCISVGSWQDPWRINGPARMKGRERRRKESFLFLSLSRESLSSICGEQYLSFSLFQFFALVAPIPDPSSVSFSLILRSSQLRSNRQIRESIPFIREGASAFRSKKRRKKSASRQCALVLPSLFPFFAAAKHLESMERCVPWNVSMLPLSPLIPSFSRKHSRSSDPHVNRPSTILRSLTIWPKNALACDSRTKRKKEREK